MELRGNEIKRIRGSGNSGTQIARGGVRKLQEVYKILGISARPKVLMNMTTESHEF